MYLSRFPRVKFAHLPTPLEPLLRLSETLGGPNIWVKRDDCTGLAGGGNKTRKLEFLMGDALAQKADTIVTQGAIQSNHCRQTAAISAKLGLSCHLLLEDRIGSAETEYNHNGNVLLDQLYDAHLSKHPSGTDMDAAMQVMADQLRDDGRRPYVIPGGGSNEIGALGYVGCALELLQQANTAGLQVDHVVHASCSAGTQAGLVAGMVGSNSRIPVLGIGVRLPQKSLVQDVYNLATSTAAYMGLSGSVRTDDVVVNCDYVGAGYGIAAPAALQAIQLVARTEGLLLDPVYTGKAMAGLIGLIRAQTFNKTDNIVFLHTGGAQGLPGYRSAFAFADYG